MPPSSPSPKNESDNAPDKKGSRAKTMFLGTCAAIGSFVIAKSRAMKKTLSSLKGEEILDSDGKEEWSQKIEPEKTPLLKQVASLTAIFTLTSGGLLLIFNNEELPVSLEMSDADKLQQQKIEKQLPAQCLEPHKMFKTFNNSGEKPFLKLRKDTLRTIGDCAYFFSIGLEQPQPCLEMESFFLQKSKSINHPDWAVQLEFEVSDQDKVKMSNCVGAQLPTRLNQNKLGQ